MKSPALLDGEWVMWNLWRFLMAIGVAVAGWSGAVLAAQPGPLVVTYDKVQIIHLAAPARRVVVGNPAIADVNLETPTMIYIFGKTPGETSIIALGDDDRALLSQSVIVTTEAKQAVSVHVPGSDGPATRAYSCVTNRCLRVASPEAGTAAPASGSYGASIPQSEGGTSGAPAGGAPAGGIPGNPMPPVR